MAGTKITALAAISTVDPVVDPLVIVDVSDTSMALTGTTKKITSQQILGSGANASVGTLTASGAVNFSSTLNVTGNLSAPNSNIASSIRAAASDYAGVDFDGATSGTRITSNMLTQSFTGTGDFSAWARFRVPATNIASSSMVFALANDATGYSSANAFYAEINRSDNTLSIFKRSAANVSQLAFAIGSFSTTYAGQIVDLVVVRVAAAWKCYVNGVDVTPESTNYAGESVDFSYLHLGVAGAAPTLNTRIYRVAVFNRALSAADIADLIANGINPADQWGTQTAAYTSDFSAGSNNWNGIRSTVTGNVDGVLGVNDTLRLVVDGSASESHYAANTSVPGMVASKRYRVAFDYYIPSGNSILNGIIPYQLIQGTPIASNQTTTGAWATTSNFEFLALGTRLDILGTANGSIHFSGNGTDGFYLKNIVLTRIGAIVDLDFTVGVGYQATDRSSNSLHGTLFGGVSWTQPKKRAVLYATTNTNGNQQILGTTAIPTSAFIESIIVNSDNSGTATTTVSVGTASAGTQIVNAGAISSGRNVLTLATRFSSTRNLWVNANGTSNLQFTILYTDAA